MLLTSSVYRGAGLKIDISLNPIQVFFSPLMHTWKLLNTFAQHDKQGDHCARLSQVRSDFLDAAAFWWGQVGRVSILNGCQKNVSRTREAKIKTTSQPSAAFTFSFTRASQHLTEKTDMWCQEKKKRC